MKKKILLIMVVLFLLCGCSIKKEDNKQAKEENEVETQKQEQNDTAVTGQDENATTEEYEIIGMKISIPKPKYEEDAYSTRKVWKNDQLFLKSIENEFQKVLATKEDMELNYSDKEEVLIAGQPAELSKFIYGDNGTFKLLIKKDGINYYLTGFDLKDYNEIVNSIQFKDPILEINDIKLEGFSYSLDEDRLVAVETVTYKNSKNYVLSFYYDYYSEYGGDIYIWRKKEKAWGECKKTKKINNIEFCDLHYNSPFSDGQSYVLTVPGNSYLFETFGDDPNALTNFLESIKLN